MQPVMSRQFPARASDQEFKNKFEERTDARRRFISLTTGGEAAHFQMGSREGVRFGGLLLGVFFSLKKKLGCEQPSKITVDIFIQVCRAV
jgi:hypothetical protein